MIDVWAWLPDACSLWHSIIIMVLVQVHLFSNFHPIDSREFLIKLSPTLLYSQMYLSGEN